MNRLNRFSLIYLCVLPLLILSIPAKSKACDRSTARLDSVVSEPGGCSVYFTLCIGGGRTGTTFGADGPTGYYFGFAVFGNPGPLSFFTPNVTSDTLGSFYEGFVTGSGFGLGEAYNIFYGDTVNFTNYTCISTTAGCGNVHLDCKQFKLTFNGALPDSIRVLGIEGFPPLGGCSQQQDMLVNLSGIYFDGLFNEPLDCNSLIDSTTFFIVNGIGSALTAGVRVTAGNVDAIYHVLALDSADLTNTTVLRTDIYGNVAGFSDSLAGTITEFHFFSDSVRYLPDFSYLGASTYKVDFYFGEILVGTETGLSGPAVRQTGNNCTRVYINGHCYERWQNVNSTQTPVSNFTVNGNTYTANSLVYSPLSPAATFIPQGKIEIRAANIPQFYIVEEGVFKFGYIKHNLGGSRITGTQSQFDRLAISRNDSSGTDGVMIKFEGLPVQPLRPWADFSWERVDSFITPPDSAEMVFTVSGSFNGVVAQPLGFLRMKQVSGQINLSADLSALGISGFNVEVYDDTGSLIGTESAPNGLFATAAIWPNGVRMVPADSMDPTMNDPYYAFCWMRTDSVEFTNSGNTYFSGDLRIRANFAPSVIDYLQAARLNISRIDSLVLLDSCFHPIAMNSVAPRSALSVKVYPNPLLAQSGNEQLHFDFSLPMTAPSQLLVSDVSGRIIRTTTLQSGTTQYNLEVGSLPAGIYFYRLAGSELSGKFILVR